MENLPNRQGVESAVKRVKEVTDDLCSQLEIWRKYTKLQIGIKILDLRRELESSQIKNLAQTDPEDSFFANIYIDTTKIKIHDEDPLLVKRAMELIKAAFNFVPEYPIEGREYFPKRLQISIDGTDNEEAFDQESLKFRHLNLNTWATGLEQKLDVCSCQEPTHGTDRKLVCASGFCDEDLKNLLENTTVYEDFILAQRIIEMLSISSSNEEIE